MSEIIVKYDPNAKQSVFHSCPADEAVYGGAKGGGKSCALVMETLAYALENPGARLYIFRETYDDLEANIINEVKEKWPQELYEYHATSHIATVHGGSKVYFRYIRNDIDANKYQGRSIDFIGVDELTKHTEKSIQILLSCLRSPKGFKPTFRATCNPGGIGHEWVKRRYIIATNYGKEKVVDPISGNTVAFIPAQVYDNEVIMKNDPAYVRRLENLPEDERKAFLLGDWDIFVGQYFKEWRHELHVIRPFKIPEHWKRWVSIDWGYNDACAVYWHTYNDGHYYTYRELYINQTMASDVAKRIKELSTGEKIEYTVGSPDMWAKRGNDALEGESIADTFSENGVWIDKANNDRINGWQRMHEVLATAPDGKPYWMIFDTCANLIRTLPALIHDDKNVEDVSDKVEDHAPESCRYFHMSRPAPHTYEPREDNAMSHVKRYDQHLPHALQDDRDNNVSWHDL